MSMKRLTGKLKLIAIEKVRDAPRWADIKKFGLKKARSRRLRILGQKNWRRSRIKV